MPFKILALGPFRPVEDDVWTGKPIPVEKANLDQVMDEFGISLYVQIPRDLCPAGGLSIKCSSLKDFQCKGIIQNTPFLKDLLDAKGSVEEAMAQGLSSQEMGERLKAWPSLPPIRIDAQQQRPAASPTKAVSRILDMVDLPEGRPSMSGQRDPLSGQFDTIFKRVLSGVFLDEQFRNLEATWRGLHFLMQQGGSNGEVRVEITPSSAETLEATLEGLLEGLIQDPPSLIILDMPFDNSPRRIELLGKIAEFAEILLVPALGWVTHRFFLINDWRDLKKLPYLPHYLEEPAFAKWRRLRGTSSGRWLALTCNRFLVRYPYGPDNKPGLVNFEETHGLWASPVWALGSLIGRSFAMTGWPTRFTDWQRIRVEDLALNRLDRNTYFPLEADLSEERVAQFVKGGITPLVCPRNKDVAFVPSESTVGGGSLRYQLFVSRIAQFLLWCKEDLGGDLDPEDIQKGLERAFLRFWEGTGCAAPERLDISVNRPAPDKPALLKINLEPSRQVLPTGERIELELNW
jgi:hypothetical protein